MQVVNQHYYRVPRKIKINSLGQNLYQPMWVELTKLDVLPFVSEKLKAAVLDGATNGWPQSAIEIE